jgi:hypothetical protein
VFEFYQIAAISKPYQLSDLSGRTLTQSYLPPKTPLTLSLESLPAGLYYLSIAYEPPPNSPSTHNTLTPLLGPQSLPLWRIAL